jgi:hypothetical protein
MKSFKDYLNKKTLSAAEIAAKHKVSVEEIEDALVVGTESEMEHTDNKSVAKEIALDHLGEDPKYYTKLKAAKL